VLKHRRPCRPVDSARRFLLRYTLDTLERISTFADVRRSDRVAAILHATRESSTCAAVRRVVTSPPYPGLIDYHEQHRYAYELLGLDGHRDVELGRPALGTSRLALQEYVDGVADVLRNVRATLEPGAPVCIVVNDRRGLYPEILSRAGLRLEDRLERHVNRRTGRRAGEYFESILVAVAN